MTCSFWNKLNCYSRTSPMKKGESLSQWVIKVIILFAWKINKIGPIRWSVEGEMLWRPMLPDPGICIIKRDPQLLYFKAKRVSNMTLMGKQKKYGSSLIKATEWWLRFQSRSNSASWSATTESMSQSPATNPQPFFPNNLFSKCFQKKQNLEEKQLISPTHGCRDFLLTFPVPKFSTNSPPPITTFHFAFPFSRAVGAGPRATQKDMCSIICILFGLAPVYRHKWPTSYLKAKLGGEIAYADFDWENKSLSGFKT